MNFKIAAAAAACLTLSALTPVAAQHPHWGYSGEGGPEKWAKLDPAYATCATGKSQSPIDIVDAAKSNLKPIKLDYHGGTSEILNNGHTVQVNYRPGSALVVDELRFELQQFHFHAPSENTFNGKHFPLEGHLVHADKDGHLAVVGVMFTEGASNPVLAAMSKLIPGAEGEHHALTSLQDAIQMLPTDRHYYRFTGSLTTPPCTEGVRWLVLQKPSTASKAQIDAIAKAAGFPNNRPVQPLNKRQVVFQ
jgi:carbonic anhydrase